MNRHRLRGVLRSAMLAGAAWLALGASAEQAFDERIDALLRLGHDRPDAALAELRMLQAPDGDVGAQRLLLLARGIVLAQSGREVEAQGWAGALRSHAHGQRDAQAEAAADLVKALGAHNAGQLDVAAGLARAARDRLQPYCPPGGMKSRAAQAAPSPQAECGPLERFQTSPARKGRIMAGCCNPAGTSGSMDNAAGSPNNLVKTTYRPRGETASSQSW